MKVATLINFTSMIHNYMNWEDEHNIDNIQNKSDE